MLGEHSGHSGHGQLLERDKLRRERNGGAAGRRRREHDLRAEGPVGNAPPRRRRQPLRGQRGAMRGGGRLLGFHTPRALDRPGRRPSHRAHARFGLRSFLEHERRRRHQRPIHDPGSGDLGDHFGLHDVRRKEKDGLGGPAAGVRQPAFREDPQPRRPGLPGSPPGGVEGGLAEHDGGGAGGDAEEEGDGGQRVCPASFGGLPAGAAPVEPPPDRLENRLHHQQVEASQWQVGLRLFSFWKPGCRDAARRSNVGRLRGQEEVCAV
mmetsp:Transcript_108162/g.312573  ORF Transcript_108162/g.312573 Transcript_108162/m.312573 type:complete len:265 (-) Transcript_108162:1478-2272(-)